MAITNYYNFYCDSNTVVCAKLPQEACFRADFFALNNSVVYFMSCAPSICATNIGSLNLQTAYKQASACMNQSPTVWPNKRRREGTKFTRGLTFYLFLYGIQSQSACKVP